MCTTKPLRVCTTTARLLESSREINTARPPPPPPPPPPSPSPSLSHLLGDLDEVAALSPRQRPGLVLAVLEVLRPLWKRGLEQIGVDGNDVREREVALLRHPERDAATRVRARGPASGEGGEGSHLVVVVS